eukprot:COSAG06_NODE_28046_length_581_cov_6.695021_1_plen_46_part_00
MSKLGLEGWVADEGMILAVEILQAACGVVERRASVAHVVSEEAPC